MHRALGEAARVAAFGAKKYGNGNFLKGMPWSELIGSAERHFKDWANGTDNDSESKLNHLGHTLWNVGCLLTYQLLGLGTDDRLKIAEHIQPPPNDVPKPTHITLPTTYEEAVLPRCTWEHAYPNGEKAQCTWHAGHVSEHRIVPYSSDLRKK
jgi:hypothetical protein